MYSKRIALLGATVVLAVGLVACGSTNQTLKTQAAGAPGTGAQKGQAAQGTAKAGETKKDGAISGSAITQPKGTTSLAAVALKDIYFDFDKYLIAPESADVLKQNSQWLASNPTGRLRVEGNCDERGTIEYNLALGQKRADAAKNFLVTLGIDGKKIETVSYGKEKPVDTAKTEDAWAKNRRDHFVPVK